MTQVTFGEGNGMTGADNGRVSRGGSATYAGLSSVSNTWVFSDQYNYTERHLSGGTYSVTIGLYRWDTSSLPDTAVINSATFRSNLVAGASADSLSFVMGWVTWDGTSASDWNATPTTDAHAGTTISSMVAGGAGDKDFTLLSPGAHVNLTGYTYLKAWISGSAPTGPNNANFTAVDLVADPGPRLIVDYTVTTPERIAPDGIISRTNLTTWETGGVNQGAASDAQALAAIDEDPDSPDTNWLTV